MKESVVGEKGVAKTEDGVITGVVFVSIAADSGLPSHVPTFFAFLDMDSEFLGSGVQPKFGIGMHCCGVPEALNDDPFFTMPTLNFLVDLASCSSTNKDIFRMNYLTISRWIATDSDIGDWGATINE
jgi:hypothetical protein